MTPTNFVFLDTKGQRWRWVRFLGLLVLTITFFGSVFFVQSLFVRPYLQKFMWFYGLSKDLHALITSGVVNYHPSLPPPWVRSNSSHSNTRNSFPKAAHLRGNSKIIRLGFYVSSDPSSFSSLEKNAQKLTHLCPEWFNLTGVPAELKAEPDLRVKEFAASHRLTLMPLLANLNINGWDPEAVETLARADSKRQKEFFSKLVEELKALDAGGVVIDWEEVDPSYRDQITNLVINLHEELSRNDLELWLCIPVGNDLKVFDLDQLSMVTDRFVALLFDENGEKDAPGPIASQPWFEEWLRVLVEHGDSRQWIVVLPTFGYDWKESEEAEMISFADSMSRAGYAHEGQIKIAPPLYAPNYKYAEGSITHLVWFTDAITFHNQKMRAEAKQVGGIAIYRIGLEDPHIWDTFDDNARPAALEQINSACLISHIGRGDFLSVSNKPATGIRQITSEPTGLWSANYLGYPKYSLIFHRGESTNKLVAITFDDGPDPRWTPKLLDILKKNNIKATFFLIGEKALSHPDLVKRIFNEGHDVGNHTFTHKDLSELSASRVIVELNATQRVIESITHYSTVLFRPPYNADRLPQSLQELTPLLLAQNQGYVPISGSIDPQDWEKPDVKTIIERVKERRRYGNVLLLHDGGGDRSETVAALPQLIDYLQRRGDEIVPLEKLIGVPRESLMPPIPGNDPTRPRLIAEAGLFIIHFIVEFFWAFLIISTIILFLRSIILLFLALIHKKREPKASSPNPAIEHPLVSVLIPAHNEEKVIRSTLQSVLNTSYRGGMEVIVVDDGSTDRTASIVSEIAASDPRVRLIQQANRGKSVALDKAFKASSYEYIIMLDADTQFQQDTIGNLLKPLADPLVGAVCGNIRVGNLHSALARFQALEYICGFNLDRRAYDMWNCINVAPGAGSAFRRKAIQEAGGLTSDTLAEDTDLTLRLHRARFGVRYASQAVAWTEAPETISGFIRQRSRWAFGTLQCLWKHRYLLFNPGYRALAFFSLPSIWFCHLLLVAIAPLVDLMLIGSLFSGIRNVTLAYIFLFSFLDISLAFAACLLDGARLRWAWRVLPMRLFYRPLLSWVVWRSIVRALRGAWVGWGKQERKGTSPSGVPEPKPITKLKTMAKGQAI